MATAVEQPPLVLGIDPGTAITGYAVVRDDHEGAKLQASGAIYTPAHTPLSQRLFSIHQELAAIIETYRPSTMAVEKVFFSRNVRTALAVGHARGVVLLAAAIHGLPVFEYSPNEVKQAISGYGGADKKQMQNMVALLLHLDEVPTPDDVADAIAIAICHIHTNRWQDVVQASDSYP
ncbi:MAG: crossover junction endodeoxyribonuclease RuvC [Chloroflexi bacterium]|nr:crossover junction endodeoxyribonuclease RuvC [Chloroflexota bacterium]